MRSGIAICTTAEFSFFMKVMAMQIRVRTLSTSKETSHKSIRVTLSLRIFRVRVGFWLAKITLTKARCKFLFTRATCSLLVVT